jgi:hypothetical protein
MNERAKRALGLGVAAVAAAAVLVAAPARAHATGVTCDVLCIWATNSEDGIDPALKDIPELKKPPFAGYKGYKLLADLNINLEEGVATDVPITPDTKLVLTLGGIKGTPPKIALHVLVPPKKLEANLLSPPGKRSFLAGLAHKDGILIIGLSCKPK